ncbi:hypothetical protein [Deinococcus pimensis]|uniref:hypothetical protein n=1 Tax=Deinococcus pimensis TaxID=309888 RepID=UPI00146FB4C2|nr:hypothetical protein [Deinococcus pimensis]
MTSATAALARSALMALCAIMLGACGPSPTHEEATAFTLDAQPATLTISPGRYVATSVVVRRTGRTDADVELSLTGAALGTTSSHLSGVFFAEVQGVTPLAISVGENVEPGVYPLLVTGRAGDTIRTTELHVNVPSGP